MRIRNIHGVFKNICCFYNGKRQQQDLSSYVYSDIVYTDHIVRMHAFKFYTSRGIEICQERKI